jgi:hypothetical protein
MTVEENGLTYNASNFVGTSKVIRDEPLTGFVSDVSEKASGSTKFTLRIPEERLDELSDDRDDYRSPLVG